MGTVGCFGKIPLASDFVSVNAGEPVAKAFVRCVEKSVALTRGRLGDEWTPLYSSSPPQGFIFADDRGGARLVGVSIPSRDSTGRVFPFSIFAVDPGKAPVAVTLTLFSSFLGEAERFLLALEDQPANPSEKKLAPLEEALSHLKRLLPALPPSEESPAATLDRTPAARLWEALGGEPERRMLNTIADRLVGLGARKRSSDQSLGFGLRFPIPRVGTPDGLMILFWLELARRTVGRRGDPAGVFWTAGPGPYPGSLDVYYRSPTPMDLAHRLDPSLASDGLYPVGDPHGSEGADEGETGQMRPGKAPAPSGQTVAALLDSLTGS